MYLIAHISHLSERFKIMRHLWYMVLYLHQITTNGKCKAFYKSHLPFVTIIEASVIILRQMLYRRHFIDVIILKDFSGCAISKSQNNKQLRFYCNFDWRLLVTYGTFSKILSNHRNCITNLNKLAFFKFFWVALIEAIITH